MTAFQWDAVPLLGWPPLKTEITQNNAYDNGK